MESWTLVTGAGTGIGRGIVLALARERQRIILVGRRRELLDSTARQAQELGAVCCVIDLDLARAGAIEELVQRVQQECGPVGVLINNAGVLMPGPLSAYEAVEIEHAVVVNLLAPMQLARAFLPDLAGCSGSLVLVASTAAWLPFPYMSLYSGTKAGLRMWGESLRTELRSQGVRLLVAYPPLTQTSMVDGMSEGAGINLRLACPLAVGQRIVTAMKSGRRELWCAWSDRCLSLLERLAPWLVHAILRRLRERFRRMTAAAQKPR